MRYTGMMLEKMLGDINSQQAEAFRKVMRYSTEFVGKISGILPATQIEAKQMRFQRSEGNVANLLQQLKQDYEISLTKDLTLKWDYPEDLPSIRTDLDNLRHVLQNLTNNAVNFTDQGYVMISARYSPKNRSISIAMAVTGIGIAPEHLSIIFEKFRQLDSSETRLHGSTRLGLYIVKMFTELLGGQIDVESEMGKGSMFTLPIPC